MDKKKFREFLDKYEYDAEIIFVIFMILLFSAMIEIAVVSQVSMPWGFIDVMINLVQTFFSFVFLSQLFDLMNEWEKFKDRN